jgi:hypothetical protein
MAIVSAVDVVACFLDPEELQTLVILLASSRHRGKFIATTTLERGGRTAFFAGAPATPPTPRAAAVGRTCAAPGGSAVAATLGWSVGAAGVTAPSLAAASASTTTAARFSTLAIL